MNIQKLIDRLQNDCLAVAEGPGTLEEKHAAVDALFVPFQRKFARTIAKAADQRQPQRDDHPNQTAPAKPREADLTKGDFYSAIEKAAQLSRRKGETREQAFARFISQDEQGRAMYLAYKVAPGEEPVPVAKAAERPMPPLTPAYQELMRRAAVLARQEGLTEAQAFAKLYTDPANRHLARAAG